jgi:hypothetical protein
VNKQVDTERTEHPRSFTEMAFIPAGGKIVSRTNQIPHRHNRYKAGHDADVGAPSRGLFHATCAKRINLFSVKLRRNSVHSVSA